MSLSAKWPIFTLCIKIYFFFNILIHLVQLRFVYKKPNQVNFWGKTFNLKGVFESVDQIFVWFHSVINENRLGKFHFRFTCDLMESRKISPTLISGHFLKCTAPTRYCFGKMILVDSMWSRDESRNYLKLIKQFNLKRCIYCMRKTNPSG